MKHVDPYLTAEALHISEAERKALIEVHRDFAGGHVPESAFSMEAWTSCIACFVSEKLGEQTCGIPSYSPALYALYVEWNPGQTRWKLGRSKPDTGHAAKAILNFLTLGNPKWAEIKAEA
jgi:hypothetical protein